MGSRRQTRQSKTEQTLSDLVRYKSKELQAAIQRRFLQLRGAGVSVAEAVEMCKDEFENS